MEKANQNTTETQSGRNWQRLISGDDREDHNGYEYDNGGDGQYDENDHNGKDDGDIISGDDGEDDYTDNVDGDGDDENDNDDSMVKMLTTPMRTMMMLM